MYPRQRAYLEGWLVIRKMMFKNRLQNAAESSHQFMAKYNHLGEQLEAPKPYCSGAAQSGPSSEQLKELLKARRARADYFGAHLFSDPAWDILLLAYVAFLDDEPFLISTLLRTSLAPATVTLRWVKVLEQDGWVDPIEKPVDGPQSCLKLSTAGKVGIERYLAAVWPSLPL